MEADGGRRDKREGLVENHKSRRPSREDEEEEEARRRRSKRMRGLEAEEGETA